MKKVVKIISFILLLGFMFTSTYKQNMVEAKTFGELKEELEEEEQRLRDNQNQQSLTKDQMEQVNSKIATIQNNIKQTYRDIENLEAEIESLTASIEQKEDQIKEIINFQQISDSDNAYLEYIFNASDFTEFIYRSAVAEQLAEYNDKLINEYNDTIEKNKQKQKEIE